MKKAAESSMFRVYAIIVAVVVDFVVPLQATGAEKEGNEKSCGELTGLWLDGSPRCLDDQAESAGGCCCRSTADGVVPQVWNGECRLVRGGLRVTTWGERQTFSPDRHVVVRGAAYVEQAPYWQGVPRSFRLEIKGGAEIWTDGSVTFEVTGKSEVHLRVDEGSSTELTHRLRPDSEPFVLVAGQEIEFDARVPFAEPARAENERIETSCGSVPGRSNGAGASLLLLALAVLGLWVRARRPT